MLSGRGGENRDGKEGGKGTRKALWKRVEFVPHDHTHRQLWL